MNLQKTLLASAFLLICVGRAVAEAAADHASRHVVLIVWDGMRPDFATEKYAPTLDKLARDGVRFRDHHSIYITATNVNGAALATGAYPNRNGIMANLEFRPAINPRQPVDTADPDVIRRGDELSGGKYLALPTIAEVLRAAGKKVALVGTKSVVILHDRHNDWTVVPMKNRSLTTFAGAPISSTVREEIVKMVGPFLDNPNATAAQRNTYATRALTEVLWRDGVPEFSLLWLSEPDFSQHNFAPGSPEAIAAIKSADDNLALLLSALDKKQARGSTDIFVVSDHAFSTIRRSIDVVTLLNKAGFRAAKGFSETPKPGDILVAGNGGTVLFYVHEHDRAVVQRLGQWLRKSDFAGLLFAPDEAAHQHFTRVDAPNIVTFSPGAPGLHFDALPLSFARIDTANSPDIVMSFRWSNEANKFGVAGMIDADWNRPAGQGTHATLSPFDINNTLVAAGPDLRRQMTDQLPSGNVDLCPTILHLLGVAAPPGIDGRELKEALRENPQLDANQQSDPRPIYGGAWQELMISRVGDKTYLDSGEVDEVFKAWAKSMRLKQLKPSPTRTPH